MTVYIVYGRSRWWRCYRVYRVCATRTIADDVVMSFGAKADVYVVAHMVQGV